MAMIAERRPISVLLVEDNPDHIHLIERRLRDGGLDVHRASSGKEALASLDGIDLVLLDYRLPDMSGLETLQEIRRIDGPSVVMVTGMGSEEIAVEAMRAGAIDYVVKDATYIRMLPEVVERAWRLHDLTRRAKQLQRLAFIVNSAEDRESIFAEIVNGARELLGAVMCALLIYEEAGLEVVAQGGSSVDPSPALMDRATKVLESGTTDIEGEALLVPLSKGGDEPLGVLAIISDGRTFIEEELDLADTFASFAGLALRNLRRRELEQRLIGELQQTLELRRDFVNSISHELRTPLACISGFATTVLTHWGRLDEETIRSSVEKIQHHGGDLTNLVEKLLDFSFLEQGRFAPEVTTMDLKPTIETSVEDLQPLVGGRQIEIDVEEVKVAADPNLLHRVLSNLISNAVKASGTDEPIYVRAVHHDGVARIEVEDRGTGLSEEDAAHVFDPFWRSRHAIKAAQRGSGIGLTLVKEYVRTMGGEVGVTSKLGTGSTFYFTLPVAG
ncbi:MAG: hybrid sensor histidine kinase/response regulator [Actinobacteria bacterium]|nr:hybrid sensor histidine kinase/response regulator [Actinomycetota bacterium]